MHCLPHGRNLSEELKPTSDLFPPTNGFAGSAPFADSWKTLCSRRNQPHDVADERPIEDILDTIGDDHARDVLAAISEEPRAASEVAEAADLSLPTVYRRIEMLKEHDLVVAETAVADDGNHYDVFKSNFDGTVIRLRDDEYDVRIYRKENIPDRFSSLWDELSR